MRRRLAWAVLAAAAVAVGLAAQGSAFGQTAPRVGAVVKDRSGANLGVIEQVVLEKNGTPYQVLVRQGQVVRPLLVDALTPQGNGYVSVLSKAEFEIIPALR